jgi:hypothetical protein
MKGTVGLYSSNCAEGNCEPVATKHYLVDVSRHVTYRLSRDEIVPIRPRASGMKEDHHCAGLRDSVNHFPHV